jgi:hypothetical protein
MGNAAKKTELELDRNLKADPELPSEIVAALEAAGYSEATGHSTKLATLMTVFADLAKAKAEVQALRASAEAPERMFPLKELCVDVSYLKAFRAAKSGYLEAEKRRGRWFCKERAMNKWRARTGKSDR